MGSSSSSGSAGTIWISAGMGAVAELGARTAGCIEDELTGICAGWVGRDEDAGRVIAALEACSNGVAGCFSFACIPPACVEGATGACGIADVGTGVICSLVTSAATCSSDSTPRCNACLVSSSSWLSSARNKESVSRCGRERTRGGTRGWRRSSRSRKISCHSVENQYGNFLWDCLSYL